MLKVGVQFYPKGDRIVRGACRAVFSSFFGDNRYVFHVFWLVDTSRTIYHIIKGAKPTKIGTPGVIESPANYFKAKILIFKIRTKIVIL